MYHMPRLLLAFESHDSTWSIWNLADTNQMNDFFDRETRLAICYITSDMLNSNEVLNNVDKLEKRWTWYATECVTPPANTPMTLFLHNQKLPDLT